MRRAKYFLSSDADALTKGPLRWDGEMENGVGSVGEREEHEEH